MTHPVAGVGGILVGGILSEGDVPFGEEGVDVRTAHVQEGAEKGEFLAPDSEFAFGFHSFDA